MSFDNFFVETCNKQRDLLQNKEWASNYRKMGVNVDIQFRYDRLPESIVSGAPIQSENEDKFDFKGLAQQIADKIVLNFIQSPYSICIDGIWGSGKSSFSKLIYYSLQNKFCFGCFPIWIDTSLIGSSNSVIKEIVKRTHSQATIYSKKILGKTIQDEDCESNLVGEERIMPCTYHTGSSSNDKFIRQGIKYAEQWLAEWQNKDIDKEDMRLLIKLLREIRWSLLGGGGIGKIVYFIDDLDRCKSGIVLKVLTIHRSLLEEIGIYLIYSMHYDIIASIIQNSFLKSNISSSPVIFGNEIAYSRFQGEMYLEKFINLRIRPPVPSENYVKDWVIFLLDNRGYFEGLEKYLYQAFSANPREIKAYSSAVKFLISRYIVAKQTGNYCEWEGLAKLNNDELAFKLISKVAALAFSRRYGHFYEIARLPYPGRLKELEIAEYERNKVDCIILTSDGLQEHAYEIPDELSIILRSGPKFAELDNAAIQSVILAVESILPPPWLPLAHLTSHIVTDKQIAYKDKTIKDYEQAIPEQPTSIFEKQAVMRNIENWMRSINVYIPKQITDTLISLAPDFVVSVFSKTNMQPTAKDLVEASFEALQNRKRNIAQWLVCAASIHPELKQEDVIVSNKLTVFDAALRASIMELASNRFPADKKIKTMYAQILAEDNENTQNLNKAIKLSLELLSINEESLLNIETTIADNFDREEFLEGFYILMQGLHSLQKEKEMLNISLAAIKTPSGKKTSGVIRTFASALVSNGKKQAARSAYEAAILLNNEEIKALYWLANDCADEIEEKIDLYYIIIDRDIDSPIHWFSLGAFLHNNHFYSRATKWLEKAVSLDPKEDRFREALSINYSKILGKSMSSKALDLDFIPDVNVEELKDEAFNKHKFFIEKVISKGNIAYEGILLFEVSNLPEWIKLKFIAK